MSAKCPRSFKGFEGSVPGKNFFIYEKFVFENSFAGNLSRIFRECFENVLGSLEKGFETSGAGIYMSPSREFPERVFSEFSKIWRKFFRTSARNSSVILHKILLRILHRFLLGWFPTRFVLVLQSRKERNQVLS